ncbi:adenine phosphoribosyltransferase [Mesomycoplasma neurolyticum]|uniref:Adenine phosphoribosyltransferase n=1 Tax=Mesomycoplasma neurolyticum TaxID=2120 RepID=A0A449A5F8_9BACT|nr:adenine phosphoribosyltransferase [Mesomycoplasma neurolyticum]VEU59462.1 adenine phosphoribosyltransferase [Mesomycoplasma neurolyticum]
MKLIKYIKDVKNFPIEGIIFKDISPLLANGEALHYTIETMSQLAKDADIIIAPDARGFLFGTPVAAKLSKPLIMIRKKGKLPGKVIQKSYDLEYGSNIIELQENMVKKGQKAVIIDDVLATGGTVKAICELLESQGVEVIKILFLMELKALEGRKKIGHYNVESLIEVDN